MLAAEVPAVAMAAVVEDMGIGLTPTETLVLARTVLALAAQSASSGPATPGFSHQQTQGKYSDHVHSTC
jgi:hypothetical protein